jgi:hypothetical protein
MSTMPQKRALSRYRKRLTQRCMARFEVLGRDADHELIRSLARQLAGDGPDARVFAPRPAVPFRGNSRRTAVFSTHYAGRLWSATLTCDPETPRHHHLQQCH